MSRLFNSFKLNLGKTLPLEYVSESFAFWNKDKFLKCLWFSILVFISKVDLGIRINWCTSNCSSSIPPISVIMSKLCFVIRYVF